MYIGLFSYFLVSFHVCRSLFMFVGLFAYVWFFFVGVVAWVETGKCDR